MQFILWSMRIVLPWLVFEKCILWGLHGCHPMCKAAYLLKHSLGDGSRELASLVEARAEQTRDLLDDGVRGQERVVALGCASKGRACTGQRFAYSRWLEKLST